MKNTIFILSAMLVAACTDVSSDESSLPPEKRIAVHFADAKSYSPDWPKGNTMIVQWKSDPGFIHPMNFNFFNAEMILDLTYCPLLIYDQITQTLQPELAKRMPDVSADQLSYSFELRDGAKWDDGSEVNADDVIFTIKAAKCSLTQNPVTRNEVENIQSVSSDANDPLRFTITDRGASIQNLYAFVDLFILSRNFFDPNHVLDHYEMNQLDDSNFHPEDHPDLVAWAKEFNDEKYGNDPANFFGCGPYKVTDWQRDQTITLQRKPNHWTSGINDNIYLNSFPDKIIFKVIADDNALELAIKSQEVDASTWLSTRALMRLESDSLFKKNYHYAYLNAYTANFIVMNMKPDGITHKRIFDDVNVRKAMAYLTPCDNLMQVMAQGKGMRWSSIMSPLKKECDTSLQLIPLDENKASQLLNEAGWKDTDGDGIRDKVVDGEKIALQFQLMIDAGAQSQNMAALIQESMAKEGVSVQIQPLDPNLKRQKISAHDFDMAIISFSNNSMPYDYSLEWKTASWKKNGLNYSGFGNEQTDALIDSINMARDEDAHIALSHRMQKIIYDQQPVIPLYVPYRKIIVHQRWGNAYATTEVPNLIYQHMKLIASAPPQ